MHKDVQRLPRSSSASQNWTNCKVPKTPLPFRVNARLLREVKQTAIENQAAIETRAAAEKTLALFDQLSAEWELKDVDSEEYLPGVKKD